MSWFFSKKVKKEELEELKKAVQTGFNSVKVDFSKTSSWIKHLNNSHSDLKQEIYDINEDLSSIKEEIENLKNMIGILGKENLFKQKQTVFNKQTLFKGVQTPVQTGVQTAFLDRLSTTERAIVFILLNSDMKLSYEDIAAMLGKSKATIRGQINSIKQKSESLIQEQISEGNKKRVFIPEKTKEILLKIRKVRVKQKKNKEKSKKES